MGPDRLLRPVDALVHRLDRASGLRARRQRRGEQRADAVRFVHDVGRWITPVAERCGYGPAQVGASSATWCGDPAEVLGRHPWAVDDELRAELLDRPHYCVDLQVGWADGWVELRANPFVRRDLVAPASDRVSLGPALEDLASRLAGALDRQEVLDGLGAADDPRGPQRRGGYAPLTAGRPRPRRRLPGAGVLADAADALRRLVRGSGGVR